MEGGCGLDGSGGGGWVVSVRLVDSGFHSGKVAVWGYMMLILG